MNDLERKFAWIGYARGVLYALIGIASCVAIWAGIKHAAKVPVVSGSVLALLCLLAVALWLLAEYLGHLGGRYTRQLLDRMNAAR